MSRANRRGQRLVLFGMPKNVALPIGNGWRGSKDLPQTISCESGVHHEPQKIAAL